MAWLVAVLLVTGCRAPCRDSADVLLTLDGDIAAFANASAVDVTIAVGGGAAQATRTLTTTPTPGATVLLSPATPLPGESYTLSVVVTLRDAGGAAVATGTAHTTASTSGCNRLSVTLIGSTSAGDLSTSDAPSVDLGGIDLAGADLSVCAATPDEDGDGRGDACDVCAANADATPLDTDGDGLPDACDPSTGVNARLDFQSFNATPAGWTGAGTTTGGALILDGSTICGTYAASGTAVTGGFQLQTYVTPQVLTTAFTDNVEVRLHAWTTVGSTGFSCGLDINTNSGVTTLYAAQGSVNGDPSMGGGGTRVAKAIANTELAEGTARRLRMTLREGALVCELAHPDGSAVTTVTQTVSTPASAFVGLGVCWAKAAFSSVFVASYP
ncbi:MAG: thrombospondin type 3 repeat-containing protein [Polyangia bacterium]